MINRICFICLLCILAHESALATGYVWTEIVVPGAMVTSAFGPNDKGQVAVTLSDGRSGIYQQGLFTPLPAPPTGFQVRALGINNAGTIVGAAFSTTSVEQGFILVNGQYKFFSKPGWDNTEPRAIGNTGLVTGYSFQSDLSADAAFVYDPATGIFTDIYVPGSSWTIAQGINRFGRISGSARRSGGNAGFISQQATSTQGTSQLVPFLAQLSVASSSTSARGINDWGIIVGFANSGGTTLGFIGSDFIGYQLLSPPGADVGSTVCEGINNAGQVSCVVTDSSMTNSHAFLGSVKITFP